MKAENRKLLSEIAKKINRSKVYVNWAAYQYVESGLVQNFDEALVYMWALLNE